MQQVGRVSGSAGFIARVGGSGATQFTMTASSFGAAIATGATPMLQTAIFGTPVFRRTASGASLAGPALRQSRNPLIRQPGPAHARHSRWHNAAHQSRNFRRHQLPDA